MALSKPFASSSVTVTTAWTDLITFNVNDRNLSIDNLVAEIHNSGGTAFSDFQLLVQDHQDGEFYALITGDGWASTTNTLHRVNPSTPKTLAGAARSHVELNLGCVNAVKFQAKVASGTTTAAVRGRFRV